MICCGPFGKISSSRFKKNRYGDDTVPEIYIDYPAPPKLELWTGALIEYHDYDFSRTDKDTEEVRYWKWTEPSIARQEANVTPQDIGEIMNPKTLRDLRNCDILFARTNSMDSIQADPESTNIQDLAHLLRKDDVNLGDVK